MKKLLWFTAPLVIVVDMVLISKIFSLISAPSDTAVWTGTLLLCILAAANYALGRYLVKTTKQHR